MKMEAMIASLEEEYSSSTMKAYKRTRDLFEKWRGEKVYSEVLFSAICLDQRTLEKMKEHALFLLIVLILPELC